MLAKKEEINDFLDKLAEIDTVIIVEGKKDRAALSSLGVRNIIILDKPLYSIVEGISEKHKEVILLTDFDKKGKELYGKLKKDFLRNGVKVDSYFREFLQRNTKLSHMEGIATYMKDILE